MRLHPGALLVSLFLATAWPAAAWPPASTLPKEQNIILRCSVSDAGATKDCGLPFTIPAQSDPRMQAFLKRAQAFIQVERDAPDYLASAKPGDQVLVMVRRSTAFPLNSDNPGRAVAPAAAALAINEADWAKSPRSDMDGYFPERALRMGVSGSAAVQWTVGAGGDLLGCWIAAQSPPDMTFGEALLKLSTVLQMKPVTKDGAPTAGRPYALRASFEKGGHISLSTAAP